MDKNPGVTCVVNKTNIIDSTYRNFKMEVLAGEENMVAKVCVVPQSPVSHLLLLHMFSAQANRCPDPDPGERKRGDVRV